MKTFQRACIIDDDKICTFGIQLLIERTGLAQSVIIFENGKKALQFLEKCLEKSVQIPDIILLDLNMPVMDGWDFLEEFEKLHAQLPQPIKVFVTSSSNDEEDMRRAKSFSTVAGYLVKPIKKEMLENMNLLLDNS